MLAEVLLSIAMVLLLYQRWLKRDVYKLGKQLNSGVWTLPFLGHSYLFIGNGHRRMKALQILGRDAIRNENDLSSMWLGNHLYAMTADPETAALVLKTCLNKDDLMQPFRFFIGNGSLIAPVPIWRLRRKLLVPMFSTQKLKCVMKIFERESATLVQNMRTMVGPGLLYAFKFYSAYTIDAIFESTMGFQIGAQKGTKHHLLEKFDIALRSVTERICKPWLRSDLVYNNLPIYSRLVQIKKYSVDFMNELIENTRKQMKENNISQEHYESKCRNRVRSNRLKLEENRRLQEVFGDSDRPPNFDDIPRLTYLDAVIKETLRLYPPGPVIIRKVEKDVLLPCGIKLVPGTGVAVNIWALHRNPRYWGDDAELFRPERFIDTPLTHPAAFMPFSYGPRNCVGFQYAMLSMKTALSTVLRRYRILPATAPNNNSEYPAIRLKFDIIMKDEENFPIRLEPRC